MNLMSILRCSGLLAIVWIVGAMGASMLGIPTREAAGARTFYLPSPSFQDLMPAGRPDGPDSTAVRLLDRTSGKFSELTTTQDPAWSLLSVSPWRDQDGSLKAVGRWISRSDLEEECCGLGVLRIPEMTVQKLMTFNILPTGKPCWVPGYPDEILFPAGNGKLYRCSVDVAGSKGSNPGANGSSATALSAHAVAWQCDTPTRFAMTIEDPAWSSEPAIREFVFVAISMVDPQIDPKVTQPSRIWWLRMNDEGDAIVEAGPLTHDDAPKAAGRQRRFERMPSIVVGPGGKLKLVYLSRDDHENTWRMRSAPLEVELSTSLPRIHEASRTHRVLAEELAPASLVFSADGTQVFAIDATGQTVKKSVRW